MAMRDLNETAAPTAACIMQQTSSSELIREAERELAETKSLVEQQYGIVQRLKRIGADTRKAIYSLIELLELQETRQQRLADVRMRPKTVAG
jgi:hypothetical protein